MGGIFGVASKDTCTMDLFFGVDYHCTLVPAGVVWLFMEKTDSTVQSITSKIPVPYQV